MGPAAVGIVVAVPGAIAVLEPLRGGAGRGDAAAADADMPRRVAATPRRRTRIFRGARAEPRGSSVGGKQWSLSDDALRAHRW